MESQPTQHLNVPTLVKGRSVYLNDRADVDRTGADPMGATISAYLAELRTGGNTEVICDAGSTYKVDGDPIVVPAQVTLQGSHVYDAPVDARCTIKAAPGATKLVVLGALSYGWFAKVAGFQLHGNSVPGIKGVVPLQHYQAIEDMTFQNFPATGVGVWGGGILYFRMRRCIFSSFFGAGIELLQANSPYRGTYYGVNLGQIEQCWFYVHKENIRYNGHLTIRDCAFETSYSAGTMGVVTAGESIASTLIFDSNYFELSGTNPNLCAVFLAGGSLSSRIYNNTIFGPSGPRIGAAIRLSDKETATGPLTITGNHFARWDVGIKKLSVASGAALDIGGNTYTQVTTPIKPAMHARYGGPSNSAAGLVEALGHGLVYYGGGIQGSLVLHTNPATQSVVDLTKGNVFEFEYSTPCTPTVINARAGMQFVCRFNNSNTTLTMKTWHLVEGVNATPAAGTSRQFYVDFWNSVREVGA